MGKSNKELAVDVAIELIKANPRIVAGSTIKIALGTEQVINIINSIHSTLEKFDKDQLNL